MNMKKFVAAALFLTLGPVAASAADLAYKARPAAVDPGYNWSGFYIGVTAAMPGITPATSPFPVAP